jgi:tetratricopeptide (TPR) repeat protein
MMRWWKPGLAGLIISWAATCFANPSFLSQIQSRGLLHPARDLAFTADEALLLVAHTNDSGDGVITLLDRQALKLINQIVSPQNPPVFIKTSPEQRLLIFGGEKRLELWEIGELSSGPTPIPESHKRWSKEVHATYGLFRVQSSVFDWSDSSGVHSLNLESLKEFEILSHSSGVQHFAMDEQELLLAWSEPSSSRIQFHYLQSDRKIPPLDYHLFPLAGFHFTSSQHLLSLDQARNLIRGSVRTRIKLDNPKINGAQSNEVARSLTSLYQDQVFLVTTQRQGESSGFAYVLDKHGTTFHRIPVSRPEAVAVSPTGAYVASAGAAPNQLVLLRSALSVPPETYLRHLMESGANETARRYRNHLDSKSALGVESAGEGGTTLRILEENLKVSERMGQWLEVERLSEEILTISLNNSTALDAKQRLQSRQDTLQVEKASQLLANQDYERAITLLTRIPSSSPHYNEARQLISVAELQAQLVLTLQNAEKEIRLQNWKGATVHLQKALKKDPEHERALEMLELVETQERQVWLTYFLIATGFAILLVGSGIWVIKNRTRWTGWILGEEPQSPSSQQTAPSQASFQQTGRSIEEDIRQFAKALDKTKELLRLVKQRDILQEHTTRLMDFEAEVVAMEHEAQRPEAKLRDLASKLLVLQQTLRSLRFKAASSSRKPSPPPVPKTTSPDHYQLLGISKSASLEEIKRAYHEKLKEYHPDRHQQTEFEWIREQAEAMTRQVREAYDTLSDPQSRKQYNQTLG